MTQNIELIRKLNGKFFEAASFMSLAEAKKKVHEFIDTLDDSDEKQYARDWIRRI